MGAKLVAEEGTLKGLTLALDEGEEWIAGRDPDECQLIIEDPSASRKHFLCRQTDDGYMVENLSDTNPIKVNDKVIEEAYLLEAGDTVKVGETLFRFTPEGFEQVEEEVEEYEDEEEGEEELDAYYDTIFREEDVGADVAVADIDFSLEETGRWLVKVIAGPNTGAEFAMQAGKSYVLGTDPEQADIVFHDMSISRKHARVSVTEADQMILEDLNSRNGVLVDDELIEGSTSLNSNSLVTIGTTTLMLVDREGSRQTIISPPIMQMREQKEEAEKKKLEEEETGEKRLREMARGYAAEQKGNSHIGSFVLIAVVSALVIILGLSTSSLFRSERVQTEQQVDVNEQIENALADYPQIRYSYTRSTGKLLLIGHVLTAIDKSQIQYNIQSLPFIKNLDDNIVVDEYVWQETNRVLGKNPAWRGVTIFSPQPGRFVMTGFLRTRAQEESLADYINLNFPYLDLLDKQVVVEETLLSEVNKRLQNQQFIDVTVQISGGELTLSGFMGFGKSPQLDKLVEGFEKLKGIRNVRNFVVELAPEESMIDLTDQYQVTGYSDQGNANYSVVINGKILSRGDNLDGMTITSIKRTVILLERDGFNFKIEYNK